MASLHDVDEILRTAGGETVDLDELEKDLSGQLKHASSYRSRARTGGQDTEHQNDRPKRHTKASQRCGDQLCTSEGPNAQGKTLRETTQESSESDVASSSTGCATMKGSEAENMIDNPELIVQSIRQLLKRSVRIRKTCTKLKDEMEDVHLSRLDKHLGALSERYDDVNKKLKDLRHTAGNAPLSQKQKDRFVTYARKNMDELDEAQIDLEAIIQRKLRRESAQKKSEFSNLPSHIQNDSTVKSSSATKAPNDATNCVATDSEWERLNRLSDSQNDSDATRRTLVDLIDLSERTFPEVLSGPTDGLLNEDRVSGSQNANNDGHPNEEELKHHSWASEMEEQDLADQNKLKAATLTVTAEVHEMQNSNETSVKTKETNASKIISPKHTGKVDKCKINEKYFAGLDELLQFAQILQQDFKKLRLEMFQNQKIRENPRSAEAVQVMMETAKQYHEEWDEKYKIHFELYQTWGKAEGQRFEYLRGLLNDTVDAGLMRMEIAYSAMKKTFADVAKTPPKSSLTNASKVTARLRKLNAPGIQVPQNDFTPAFLKESSNKGSQGVSYVQKDQIAESRMPNSPSVQSSGAASGISQTREQGPEEESLVNMIKGMMRVVLSNQKGMSELKEVVKNVSARQIHLEVKLNRQREDAILPAPPLPGPSGVQNQMKTKAKDPSREAKNRYTLQRLGLSNDFLKPRSRRLSESSLESEPERKRHHKHAVRSKSSRAHREVEKEVKRTSREKSQKDSQPQKRAKSEKKSVKRRSGIEDVRRFRDNDDPDDSSSSDSSSSSASTVRMHSSSERSSSGSSDSLSERSSSDYNRKKKVMKKKSKKRKKSRRHKKKKHSHKPKHRCGSRTGRRRCSTSSSSSSSSSDEDLDEYPPDRWYRRSLPYPWNVAPKVKKGDVNKIVNNAKIDPFTGENNYFDWRNKVLVCVHKAPGKISDKMCALVKLLELTSRKLYTIVPKDEYSPATYAKLIIDLENRFGGSERLLNELSAEVREHPEVKSGCPESLSSLISALYRYLKAQEELEDSSDGRMLFQEVYAKLPRTYRLEYGRWFAVKFGTNRRKSSRKVNKEMNISNMLDWMSLQLEILRTEATIYDVEKEKVASQFKKVFLQGHNQLRGSSREKPERSFRNDIKTAEVSVTKKYDDPLSEVEEHNYDSDTGYGYVLNDPRDRKCPLCLQDHSIRKCEKFLGMTPKARRECIVQKRMKVCFNCLGPHISMQCTSKFLCQVDNCGKKHHTLLHGSEDNHVRVSMANVCAAEVAAFKALNVRGEISLRTIPLRFINRRTNKSVVHNALVDSGAQHTMLSQKVQEELDLEGQLSSYRLAGVAGLTTEFKRSMVTDFDLETLDGSFRTMMIARVIPNPVGSLEARDWTVLKDKWNHLKDINFPMLQSNTVEIIIGQQHADLISSLQEVHGDQRGDPVASLCRLGWSVRGPVTPEDREVINSSVLMAHLALTNVYKAVELQSESFSSALIQKDPYGVQFYEEIEKKEQHLDVELNDQVERQWQTKELHGDKMVESEGSDVVINNNLILMASIPSENQVKEFELLTESDEQVFPNLKALKVKWDSATDSFTLNGDKNNPKDQTWTKRSILKNYSGLFDPLGFILLKFTEARIIVQNCWRKVISWDEILKDYKKLVRQLGMLPNIHMHRCLKPEDDNITLLTHSRNDVCWIKSESRDLRLYVSNRTFYIQKQLMKSVWRWVDTKSNSAGVASLEPMWQYPFEDLREWLVLTRKISRLICFMKNLQASIRVQKQAGTKEIRRIALLKEFGQSMRVNLTKLRRSEVDEDPNVMSGRGFKDVQEEWKPGIANPEYLFLGPTWKEKQQAIFNTVRMGTQPKSPWSESPRAVRMIQREEFCEDMVQILTERFVVEYLPTLNKTSRWSRKFGGRQLKDVVMNLKKDAQCVTYHVGLKLGYQKVQKRHIKSFVEILSDLCEGAEAKINLAQKDKVEKNLPALQKDSVEKFSSLTESIEEEAEVDRADVGEHVGAGTPVLPEARDVGGRGVSAQVPGGQLVGEQVLVCGREDDVVVAQNDSIDVARVILASENAKGDDDVRNVFVLEISTAVSLAEEQSLQEAVDEVSSLAEECQQSKSLQEAAISYHTTYHTECEPNKEVPQESLTGSLQQQ